MENKIITSPAATSADSFILARNSQGMEVRAGVLRLTRYLAVFEVYNPYSILQLSEVLSDFKIIINDRVDVLRQGGHFQRGEHRHHAHLRGDSG